MTQITLEISADLAHHLRHLAVEEHKSVEQVAAEKLSLLIPAPGSPQALLQALREMPKLEPGDVDALEEEIRKGRLPAREGGIFD